MTAPARVPGAQGRSTTLPERGADRSAERTRTPADAARRRSAAAQRAYERRAQRQGRVRQGTQEHPLGVGGRTPFVLFVMGLLSAGIVSTLWLSTTATADSYRLEEVRSTNQNLSEQVEELRREVAAQESPDSLVASARALGMVPAGDPARLLVKPDGSVAVVAGASPAAVPAGPPPNADPQPAPASPPPAPQPQPGQPQQPQQPSQPQPSPQQQANQQQPNQPAGQPNPAAQAAPAPAAGQR